MFLYIIISNDKTHFKIGISKDLTKIYNRYKNCDIDIYRSIFIKSDEQHYIKFLEAFILNKTKQQLYLNKENNAFIKIHAGHTELRSIEAFEETIQSIELFIGIGEIKFKCCTFIRCYCDGCKSSSINILKFDPLKLKEKAMFLLKADF